MLWLKNVLKITSSKRVLKSHYVSSGVPFYRTKEIEEIEDLKAFVASKANEFG